MHRAKTFSETPPAYGRQNSRILTDTGVGEIQIDRSCAAAALLPPLSPDANLARASWARRCTEAFPGSSIRAVSSNPRRSCSTQYAP